MLKRKVKPYRKATKYPNSPPRMNRPAVPATKGMAKRFSRLYRPGEMKAQTWYKIQGDAKNMEQTKGSLNHTTLKASMGVICASLSGKPLAVREIGRAACNEKLF